MKKQIKSAFINSIIVTVIFIIAYAFYNIEIVRANIEDIAYDAIDKFIIEKKEAKAKAPNIFILAIDDNFMKANKLYDEDNTSNYGYTLPRDKLAQIIKSVDELTSEIEPQNQPKALFLDYDIVFTTMPYGKELSKEDIEFLNTLKADRNYTIILPKTSKYNFVQNSKDSKIQELIKQKKIIFASVGLLKSSDNSIRRYPTYQTIKEINGSTTIYPNVNVLLYFMLNKNKIPTIAEINSTLKPNDIIANRIRLKSYKSSLSEGQCTTTQSYWKTLTKLSANCNLFEIDEEDYKNSIIMVGGTHQNNDDSFEVLNVLSADTMTGVEINANALLTLLNLNGQTNRLSLPISATLIFATFFFTSILVSSILSLFKIKKSSVNFIVTLIINTAILIAISIYLLINYNLWFNWFVPLILFEAVEAIDFIKDYTPKIINKIKRKNDKK